MLVERSRPPPQIFDLAPRKRDRCLQEVHLLHQLSHPHIMRMLDAFIDNNQLIIICEWAPGGERLCAKHCLYEHAVQRAPALAARVACPHHHH